MVEPNRKDISLTNLIVNTENPRFDLVADQREAIRTMLSDQREKIVNLAKDIVQHGMNPSDLTIVAPLANDEGLYNVLEGNRRVVALKLLIQPDLVTTEHKAIQKRFKELAKGYKQHSIRTITCVVYENPEDAYRWIKLKHTGQNDGVGTVGWDAQQVARFDERVEGKSAVALQALDFLNKSNEVDESIRSNIAKIPITNFDRLITDKSIQEVVGIRIEDGRLRTDLTEREVVKGLSKIARDLILKKIKVRDIYTKKDRERYIESFGKKDLPNKTVKTDADWELISPNRTARFSGTRKRSISLTTNRKTVLPKDCIMQIREKRINKIYFELKRLPCDEFTNAAAILMRVFVELSADAYLKKHPIRFLNQDSKLSQKITGISDLFETNNILSKHELKGIRTATSNKNNIMSIDTFNSYVHNTALAPLSSDLKLTWDNIQLFVEKIWEQLN
jgi:hypothetical protein